MPRLSPLSYNIIPQPRNTVSEQERREFTSLLPKIIEDLTERFKNYPEVTNRYTKVLQYNLPNHKQAPGLLVVSAYKMFQSDENLNHLANILGWCTDLAICSCQINDDIIDGSEVRRGLPCWYKKDMGNQAINDAELIANGPFILLEKYFSKHHCYFPCVEWVHEVNLRVAAGQSLDTMNRLDGKPNLQTFTMDRYKSIAELKGTYGQYLLPIKLAMYLAKNYDAYFHKQIQNILFDLGKYFTAQNDILDCYGDSSITGKVGSDIREGKCTWLVVIALQRATEAQRKLLAQHYGRSEPQSDLQIRALYEELEILDTFLQYEEQSYNKIYKEVKEISQSKTQQFFIKLLNTTYGR